MTKFNVGDRVRIMDDMYSGFIGKEGAIIEDDRSGCAPYLVKLDDGSKRWKSDRFLKPVNRPLISARLSEAEAEIATLKAKVAALEKAQVEASFEQAMRAVRRFAQADLQAPIQKSTNSRRADVIKRAQAFVADLEERASSTKHNADGNHTFNTELTYLTFHVNTEKRVVTAIAKYLTGEIAGKDFANCAPDDVFNADIGKAIAAGRLYGVDIPKEFTDAPKPTVVVVGMRVKAIGSISIWGNGVVKQIEYSSLGTPGYRVVDGSWNYSEEAVIIDDTDTVYETADSE